MNYDLLLLVLFYIFLLIIFKLYRNKFEVQWKIFALYKTKIGIKLMEKIANKFPKALNFLGYVSVFIGFIGMVLTTIFIAYFTYKLLFVPKAEAALAPLLPGISVSDKLPVLSFWHWIIAILIVAVIHEFSHGIFARLKNIKIKSSGFAFLGPILAAFVEPDEKELKRKPIRDQLFVFSAGPFSNIILGIVILLILSFVFVPIGNAVTEIKGVNLIDINDTLPINNSGLKAGQIIEEIDSVKIDKVDIIPKILDKKSPGDMINVKANGTYYNFSLASRPENSSKALIGGVFGNYQVELKENYKNFSWIYKIFGWLVMLFFWIFNISIGVGLFNLLPLGPVDGGRMFHSAMLHITKNKNKAMKILNYVSFFILAMILINLMPFIIRMLKFIFSPLF
ncbi:site-2 protease family protein [Candidatus Woesearchaeota archaeon]|nr:site-2 protease family protein [Candidatus Woesearchaeota archaeon]